MHLVFGSALYLARQVRLLRDLSTAGLLVLLQMKSGWER